MLRFEFTDEIRDLPPMQKASHDYWLSAKGDRPAPTWKDLKLTGFSGDALKVCLVVDVLGDPARYRYRYWGSSLYDAHGYDLTGRCADEVTPVELAEALVEQYAISVEKAKPLLFMTEAKLSGEYVKAQQHLRLPIMGEDGGVEKIISFVHYPLPDHETEALFRVAGGD